MIALNTYLKEFAPYLEMKGVTDICINRPEEIWVEQYGEFSCYDAPVFTADFLWQFTQLVAEANQREIKPENPTLSAVLPNGLRVQFVIEPGCEQDSFICAIRQKAVNQVLLADYFKPELAKCIQKSNQRRSFDDIDQALLTDYQAGNYETFLIRAMQAKKNIVIIGGTSTGKTTVLNSLAQTLPPTDRLITIETDREVFSSHRNAVHLLAPDVGQGVANISMLGLLKVTLRLRPDRILLSEIREYEEAYPYLRAINSGHPGSLTTLHADSPMSCFDQLAFMMLQGGSQLSQETLVRYTRSIINIIIQIKREASGKRYISEIYFDLAEEEAKHKPRSWIGVSNHS